MLPPAKIIIGKNYFKRLSEVHRNEAAKQESKTANSKMKWPSIRNVAVALCICQ